MATFNIRYDGEIIAVVEAEDARSPHTSITKVGDNDEAWGALGRYLDMPGLNKGLPMNPA